MICMTKITIQIDEASADLHYEVIKDIEGAARSIERPELPVIEV